MKSCNASSGVFLDFNDSKMEASRLQFKELLKSADKRLVLNWDQVWRSALRHAQFSFVKELEESLGSLLEFPNFHKV